MTTSLNFPYAKQSIDSSDLHAVSDALSGAIITRGAQVDAFEQEIAAYCGAQFGVAFNSASVALLAACYAAELGPSDRVLTTPNTFVASVTCAMQRGATPVFLDIDLETGSLDLEQLESNLKTHQTRGKTVILPVHFAGIALDMRAVDRMIQDPETITIEDAAHAFGSCYPTGEKVGCCKWSQMTIFSFHPAKTITTGEGGMVMTNDERFYKRLCLFRNNCIEREDFFGFQGEKYPGAYDVVGMSSNYNLTSFQAALGLSQLKRSDLFIAKRRELVSAYRKQLEGTPHLKMFTSKHDALTAFHLFVVQIDFTQYQTTREIVMNKLLEKEIGTQVHYIPVYRHSFMREQMGDLAEYFPATEQYYQEALTLPLYYDLQVKDVEKIVKSLKEILTSEQQRPKSVPAASRQLNSQSRRGRRR